MALNAFLRWAFGLLGAGLVAFAAWLALADSDGVTVVGFLGTGVILLVLAAIPVLPTKIGMAGGSLEYQEQLVDREYIAYIETKLDEVMADGWRRQAEEYAREHPDEPFGAGATSGGFEADIATARRLAREARTPGELNRALEVARQAAEERVMMLRYAIESPRGIG